MSLWLDTSNLWGQMCPLECVYGDTYVHTLDKYVPMDAKKMSNSNGASDQAYEL